MDRTREGGGSKAEVGIVKLLGANTFLFFLCRCRLERKNLVSVIIILNFNLAFFTLSIYSDDGDEDPPGGRKEKKHSHDSDFNFSKVAKKEMTATSGNQTVQNANHLKRSDR